jgi:hypothetical protein
VVHLLRAFLQYTGGDYGEAQEAATKYSETGAAFGLSLLFAVVYAAALVGATFLMVKMLKGNLSFLNVVNIAAYASLPVIAMPILNLVLGFIWGLLPMLFMAVAMVASFYLIYRAVSETCGAKNAFVPYTIFTTIMLLVVFLGAYFIFDVSLDVF